MSYQLGIDLGTTYTAAAVCRSADRRWVEPEVVTLGTRAATVPSVLFVAPDGTVVIGEAAERRALTDPDRVVREFKRRIGDPTPIVVGGRAWAPEELSARLVRWVVDRVAEREGGPAAQIALTHPASWGAHKKDLLTAALAAQGLRVSLLAEPQAAALHYATQERVVAGSTIAVYDLGGGTFDAAVVRKADKSEAAFGAAGFGLLGRPEGLDRLGGVDFDEVVFEHVREGLPTAFADLDDTDPGVLSAVSRVRRECTEAKEALSADTDVSIPVLLPAGGGSVRLHRSEFESMIRPQVEETVEALRKAVRSAGCAPDALTAVLLVGGSSRIPLVAQLVSEGLGRPVAVDTDPKNAIAKGAALSVSPKPTASWPEVAIPPVPGGYGAAAAAGALGAAAVGGAQAVAAGAGAARGRAGTAQPGAGQLAGAGSPVRAAGAGLAARVGSAGGPGGRASDGAQGLAGGGAGSSRQGAGGGAGAQGAAARGGAGAGAALPDPVRPGQAPSGRGSPGRGRRSPAVRAWPLPPRGSPPVRSRPREPRASRPRHDRKPRAAHGPVTRRCGRPRSRTSPRAHCSRAPRAPAATPHRPTVHPGAPDWEQRAEPPRRKPAALLIGVVGLLAVAVIVLAAFLVPRLAGSDTPAIVTEPGASGSATPSTQPAAAPAAPAPAQSGGASGGEAASGGSGGGRSGTTTRPRTGGGTGGTGASPAPATGGTPTSAPAPTTVQAPPSSAPTNPPATEPAGTTNNGAAGTETPATGGATPVSTGGTGSTGVTPVGSGASGGTGGTGSTGTGGVTPIGTGSGRSVTPVGTGSGGAGTPAGTGTGGSAPAAPTSAPTVAA